jgi:hypothetical protein
MFGSSLNPSHYCRCNGMACGGLKPVWSGPAAPAILGNFAPSVRAMQSGSSLTLRQQGVDGCGLVPIVFTLG